MECYNRGIKVFQKYKRYGRACKTNLKIQVIYYMYDGPTTLTWSNQVTTWEHLSSHKLSSSSCTWTSTRSRERSLTNLKIWRAKENNRYYHIRLLLKKDRLPGDSVRLKVNISFPMDKIKLMLTTRLPFSKVIVYLRVQKSRAGARVVGAYTYNRTDSLYHHVQ